MFDPTIGAWLQEDPIGFDGGDTNLHRYVGNNGVNATDRNGLAEKEIGPSPRLVAVNGKPPTPAQLREYEFDFDLRSPTVKEEKLPDDGKVQLTKGLAGTIKVTTGVDLIFTLKNPEGKRVPYPPIEEGIIIELTAPRNADDYRWMQFVTRIPSDADWKLGNGSYPVSRPVGVIRKFGERHLDTLSSYSAFADEETLGERSNTRSMIYDPPSVRRNERIIFDTYLISTTDGRPVYVVHWEMWGEAKGGAFLRKYENISGRPIQVLPLSISTNELASGYVKKTGKPNFIPNPVATEFYHPLSTEGLRLKIK